MSTLVTVGSGGRMKFEEDVLMKSRYLFNARRRVAREMIAQRVQAPENRGGGCHHGRWQNLPRRRRPLAAVYRGRNGAPLKPCGEKTGHMIFERRKLSHVIYI